MRSADRCRLPTILIISCHGIGAKSNKDLSQNINIDICVETLRGDFARKTPDCPDVCQRLPYINIVQGNTGKLRRTRRTEKQNRVHSRSLFVRTRDKKKERERVHHRIHDMYTTIKTNILAEVTHLDERLHSSENCEQCPFPL